MGGVMGCVVCNGVSISWVLEKGRHFWGFFFLLLVHSILCLYILSSFCVGLAWQFHGVFTGLCFSA